MPNQWEFFHCSLFMIQAGLRSNFKNSCSMYVFHRGFQTLKNNKSNRAMASCLNHQFSRVSKPWWNSSTRFRNITSNILLDILWIGQHRGVYLRQISSIQTKQTLWDNLGCDIKHCLACTWCCYSGREVGVESMVRSSLVIAEKHRTVIWGLQQRGDIKKTLTKYRKQSIVVRVFCISLVFSNILIICSLYSLDRGSFVDVLFVCMFDSFTGKLVKGVVL